MRDPIRARLAAIRAVRAARQQLSAFLLRHERVYPTDKTTWTKAHRGWLADQSFAEPAEQIVLQENIEAVHAGEQRRDRVDGHLRVQIPGWRLYPLVRNLCALRGLDTIVSAGLAPSRFATAPDFMAYLGLVPSESSSWAEATHGCHHQNWRRARTHPADRGRTQLPLAGPPPLIWLFHGYAVGTLASLARNKLAAVDAVPDTVRAVAWKAQTRLCRRYRQMMARGKLNQVIVTAIARELAGFVWSIACITPDPPATGAALAATLPQACPDGRDDQRNAKASAMS
jgi:transposase